MKSVLFFPLILILLNVNLSADHKETNVYKSPILGPLLASTFIGGSATDGAYYTGDDIKIDANGNIFVTGATTSLDFPTQPGAFNQNNSGGSDVYIIKMSSDLSTLLACTYIGGRNNDEARDLVIDQNGNIYVTGITESSNFPTINSSFDTSYNGGSSSPYGSGDAFVCKLDNNLSQLLASTFIGGSGHDNSSSITFDNNNNVFISGTTSSINFPYTSSAYDTTYQPGGNFQDDVFIVKLDNNLSTLLAGTYLGGSADDFSEAIAVDNAGNVYVSGWLTSTNFPTTPGCYDNSYNGYYYDSFISKLNNDLSNLIASTFLGGSSWEFIYGMCLDDNNNVYVTGHTSSTNFPTSASAYDRSYNSSSGANIGDDVFVTKLNNSLSAMEASTYLGGSQWENGWNVSLENNNVYVSGTTSSNNFPTSPNAYDSNYDGGNKYNGDVFISKLDYNLTTLNASTYLGSTGNESIGSIGIVNNGNVYISGSTSSQNFPYVSTAYDTSFNGGPSDIFVSILDSLLSGNPSSIQSESQPNTFTLYSNYPNPFNPTTTIKYDLPNKLFVSLEIYNMLGQHIKTLISKYQSAGTKTINWDGKDKAGRTVSTGVYFYKIDVTGAVNYNQCKKMILIR
jgi:flagellar hook capping protein FlgD/beta-propeller repeat-containing protein